MGECKDHRSVVDALSRLGVDPAEAFRLFGQRGFEAWQLVKNRCVKKYFFKPSGRVQWIIVGDGTEYIIYEKAGFCSCDDFFHESMDTGNPCKHLIAQRLAENLDFYDIVEEDDETYLRRLNEWRKLP